MKADVSEVGKPTRFKAGKGPDRDPRINQYGRPTDLEQAKKLLNWMMSQKCKGKDGQPIIRDGHTVTNAEQFFMLLMQSKNPADRRLILEYWLGKITQVVSGSGKDGALKVEHILIAGLDDLSNDELREE